jgi:hypothetical protein
MVRGAWGGCRRGGGGEPKTKTRDLVISDIARDETEDGTQLGIRLRAAQHWWRVAVTKTGRRAWANGGPVI